MSRNWWLKIVSAAIALGSVPAALGATCESLPSVTIPFATITTVQSVPAGTFTPPVGAPIKRRRSPSTASPH